MSVLDVNQANPEGTWIEEFEIRRVLGRGGFGITYEAMEHERTAEKAPLRLVALKEYFPNGIAWRIEDSRVIPARLQDAEETFYAALKAFKKEAQTLVRFDHPSIVRVQSVFESHGTAYYAMPYIRGLSLEGLLKQRGGTLPDAEIRSIVTPLLQAIGQVHAAGTAHRDIKPANIMLREEDRRPILIDFGAAKQIVSDATKADPTKALTQSLLFVSDGYSAPEQYGTHESIGPATDLYALCATLFRCMTGSKPTAGYNRALDASNGHPDALLAPDNRKALERYSPGLVRAVLWGLAVRANDRPQSAADLLAAIEGRLEPPQEVTQATRAMPGAAPVSTTQTLVREAPPRMGTRTEATSPDPGSPVGPAAAAAAASRSRTPWFAAMAVALAVVFGIGAYRLKNQAPAPAVAPPVATAPAATAPAATGRVAAVPGERETSLELLKLGVKMDVVRTIDPTIRCVQNVAKDYRNCRSRVPGLTYAGVAVERMHLRINWHDELDRVVYRFAPGTKDAALAAVVKHLGKPTVSDASGLQWIDGGDYTKLAPEGNAAASLTIGNTHGDDHYRQLRISAPADPATLPKGEAD